MEYSDHIRNTEEVFLSNNLTIAIFSNTFYRGNKCCADEHLTVLYCTHSKYSRSRFLLYTEKHK